MIILTQFILAHLIGDFFLQSKAGVAQKEVKQWRAPFLYVHALIHFALILIITWNPALWFPALLVTAIHLIIDGLKLQLQNHQNRVAWFFGDQILHVLSIFIVWHFLLRGASTPAYPFADFYWLIITGAVFVTQPVGISIGVILSPSSRIFPETASVPAQRGRQFTGVLERLLTYILILVGQLAVAGILILAVSIFRYRTSMKSKEPKFTEYILIKTVLSFLLAILTGLGVIFLIGEALDFGLYL